MTDITIIKVATPRIIPIKENFEITLKKPSLFFGLKYLEIIKISALFINFVNFY